MAVVTCPFTSPACPGQRSNSGELGLSRRGSPGLQVPTRQAPERPGRAPTPGLCRASTWLPPVSS